MSLLVLNPENPATEDIGDGGTGHFAGEPSFFEKFLIWDDILFSNLIALLAPIPSIIVVSTGFRASFLESSNKM